MLCVKIKLILNLNRRVRDTIFVLFWFVIYCHVYSEIRLCEIGQSAAELLQLDKFSAVR